ncbi:hypothetical protein [Naumannella huperziae]
MNKRSIVLRTAVGAAATTGVLLAGAAGIAQAATGEERDCQQQTARQANSFERSADSGDERSAGQGRERGTNTDGDERGEEARGDRSSGDDERSGEHRSGGSGGASGAARQASTGDPDVSGANGLSGNAQAALDDIREEFPEISTIGGVRNDPGSDHNDGRALDIMIPNYDSAQGRALGDRVAAYLRDNADRYDVSYVIWQQQIWNVQRADEGWRDMEDRGSDTQNHRDHVHLSVN